MEPSTEIVSQAPIVTKNESSFTESTQELKVQQISNGTVESSLNAGKSVSQSVQSIIQNADDQTMQHRR